MANNFCIEFSKNDESIILDRLKKFHEHNITIPEKGVHVHLENGTIIMLNGIKKSGVEGGFIFSLCDKNAQVLDGQTYMGKVLFSSKDISRRKYRRPNSRNIIMYLITSRTKDEVNADVIEEYVASKLANVIYNGIAPDVKLGQVNNDKRLFLVKKMLGQGKNENFSILKDLKPEDLSDISKEQWQAAYAVTVGLLNDRDANKGDNIGVVASENKKKLSLIDFGHVNPNKFAIDNNFLPCAWTEPGKVLYKATKAVLAGTTAPQIYTMEPYIQDKLTSEQRKEALKGLLDKQKEVFECLESIEQELKDENYGKYTNIISNLKKELKTRFDYLRKVTGQHTAKTLVEDIETGDYKKRFNLALIEKWRLFKRAISVFFQSLLINHTPLCIAILRFKIQMAQKYLEKFKELSFFHSGGKTDNETDPHVTNAINEIKSSLDIK